jgi:hypothetical protein
MKRALLLAAALLAACNTGFDPQYRVTDLRILAIRDYPANAPPPSPAADLNPTDTLALDALVVNTLSRPGFEVRWVACLPPASDALVPCADNAYLADPAKLLAAASVPGSGVLLLPSGPHIEVPLPDVTAALQFAVYLASRDQTYECRLYSELVVVAIAQAEGKQSIAQKRVRILPTAQQLASTPGVENRYTLNLNPIFGDIRLQPDDRITCAGGISICWVPGQCKGSSSMAPFPGPFPTAPFPAGKIVMCGQGGAGDTNLGGGGSGGAVGQYNVCNPSPPGTRSTSQVNEILDWQWYVTDGDFPKVGGVGDAMGGDVDFERPPGAFTLWAIVRDGRGGVDWASFAVSTL